MKLSHICAAVGLAATCAFAAPAGADPASDLLAKTTAAAASITSMKLSMDITVGTSAISTVITFQKPDRAQIITTSASFAIQMYVVGDGFSYMHTDALGWQKFAIDSAQIAALAEKAKIANAASEIKILPDRIEDGSAVGVYSATTSVPAMYPNLQAAPQTKTAVCSYDKQTYLPRKCTVDGMTLTYSNLNDPANVVELPAEAKNATLLTMPMPVTSPAPAPSATP